MDIKTATEEARKRYLPLEGIVAVSHDGARIIFYVETEADVGKVPRMFMGYPCTAVVIGRLTRL